MSEPHPEWLILAITLIALGLAPLASKLVRNVGERVSDEVGGRPPDETDERRARDDEIAQMLEARAYIRARRGEQDGDGAATQAAPPDDDLHEEVRQIVVAGNERRVRMGEEPLDVEAEVRRRVARLTGGA